MYRIKELRLERNISQKKLSLQVGVSQSVLCDYENGKVEPTASVIISLAKFFGVSTDYLLGLSEY